MCNIFKNTFVENPALWFYSVYFKEIEDIANASYMFQNVTKNSSAEMTLQRHFVSYYHKDKRKTEY